MRPLRTDTDVLAQAHAYAPTTACMRAIDNGMATVQWGVKLPSGFEGWLVTVTSPYKRVWRIAIWEDPQEWRYRGKVLTDEEV